MRIPILFLSLLVSVPLERGFATSHARELARRGDCEDALRSIERSQSTANLGGYAAESTYMKARCLERLGRTEEALAHLRMIHDFYPDSSYMHAIDPKRRADFEATRPEGAPPASPAGVRMPRVRYERHAERSRITGPVLLQYTINREGRAERIRVLRAAHPMLASWAIESVAALEVKKSDRARMQLPLHGGTAFDFQTVWTREEEEAREAEAVARTADAEPGGDDEGAGEDDEAWRWEWFPDGRD
jgi:hypothetical protein